VHQSGNTGITSCLQLTVIKLLLFYSLAAEVFKFINRYYAKYIRSSIMSSLQSSCRIILILASILSSLSHVLQ